MNRLFQRFRTNSVIRAWNKGLRLLRGHTQVSSCRASWRSHASVARKEFGIPGLKEEQRCVFVAIHCFFAPCDTASWRRAGPSCQISVWEFKRERAAVIIVISVVVDAIGKNDSGPAVPKIRGHVGGRGHWERRGIAAWPPLCRGRAEWDAIRSPPLVPKRTRPILLSYELGVVVVML